MELDRTMEGTSVDYKQKVAALEQECGKIENKLVEIESQLNELDLTIQELSEKETILSYKKSSYAMTLLGEVRAMISDLTKQIEALSSEKRDKEDELKKMKMDLHKKQTDPSEFIEEQIPKMITAFWEFVEANKHDLGMALESTYRIEEVTWFQDDHYSGCKVPTGKVGIIDKSTGKWIVKTDDYPFKQQTHKTYRVAWDELSCTYSEWFTNYVSQFVERLSVEIARKSENEVFEISAENGVITLTLV